MPPADVFQRNDSKVIASADHYTFRVRRRGLHALVVLGVVWFAWSEGAEVVALFGNLIGTLK